MANPKLKKIKNRVIGLAALAAVLYPSYSYFVPETIKTRITDASMVKVDGKYMIATENEPFQNYDAFYRGKFSSGSVQNEAIRLKGKQVELRVYGWRNSLFSWYRNVRNLNEVKQ